MRTALDFISSVAETLSIRLDRNAMRAIRDAESEPRA